MSAFLLSVSREVQDGFHGSNADLLYQRQPRELVVGDESC
jgi:hypothetical protein